MGAVANMFGCIYHWSTTAMFVVPSLVVGGWSWWKSRGAEGGEDGQDPARRLELEDDSDFPTRSL